jgi:hypothetical protein
VFCEDRVIRYRGDAWEFNWAENATFSDTASRDPIVVHVDGKDVSGFLWVELFKNQPHNIELFPAVLKHGLEVQGIRFFFQIRHGTGRSWLQKVISTELQIEKADFDIFLGDRRLSDRAGAIALPLVREAQTFQFRLTGDYPFHESEREIIIDAEEFTADTWATHTPVPFSY